jgi:hypothetical protein
LVAISRGTAIATASNEFQLKPKHDEHATAEPALNRIDMLEEVKAQVARIRQVAEARLDEEVQRRAALKQQLDAARQELQLAKAEAESCWLERYLAEERLGVLQGRLRQLEAAPPTPTNGSRGGNGSVVLEHLKQGLEEIDRARSDEILSTLVQHLKHIYVAVAVFTVTMDGLRLWKSRADFSTADPVHIPSLDSEWPVSLACRQRTTVSTTAGAAAGLWERPVGHAIALPIVVFGRVMAVAYAENPPGHARELDRVLDAIAQTLVGGVNQRLNSSAPAARASVESRPPAQAMPSRASIELDQYAVSRQAQRVRINSGVEVLVDGIGAALIDVSAVGVQIVSPTTLHPNRVVRIQLPGERGSLTCEGRIVWAQLESPRADAPAAYRAGVRFADVDSRALTTFISRHAPADISSAVRI